ncbi:MAG: thioredoxin-dependent thiol peroxidase [Chloroflexota bacterium]|nr:thioredoxin-dependent thiol peroxidase [Chloroflexota bacterium]
MAESTLQVGDSAPDFTVQTDTDETLHLYDLLGKRVVLYFYPKDDTPGCTIQACGLRDAYPQITEQNAVVLGVSTDSAASHRQFKTKYDLPFTLLVDSDHAIAAAYGVWGEQSFLGKKYMGVTRSQFIIDEQGKLADVQVPIKPTDSAKRALALAAG